MSAGPLIYISGVMPMTGETDSYFAKGFKAGEETPDSKGARFENMIEEESAKVRPTAGPRGKIVRRDENSPGNYSGNASGLSRKPGHSETRVTIREEGERVDFYA